MHPARTASRATRSIPFEAVGANLDVLFKTQLSRRDQARLFPRARVFASITGNQRQISRSTKHRRAPRYWNLQLARKPMEREKDALGRKIGPKQSHVPMPELIGGLNRQLKGWANYCKLGHPRKAFGQLNDFVRYRLGRHLRRRSQRGWRAREGVSLYAHLAHLGLVLL